MATDPRHSNRDLILQLKQERLETEIALYASKPQQLDEIEERRLRNTLVSSLLCSSPWCCFLIIHQVEFLDDAHSQQFPKSRYMRHITNIIASAIRDEVFVPWARVHAKACLRGTESNLLDAEALSGEQCVVIPRSPFVPQSTPGLHSALHVIPKGILRPPPADTESMASDFADSCQLCVDIRIPCTWKPQWVACIPCNLKHRSCPGAPLRRAQQRAEQTHNVINANTGQPSAPGVQPQQPGKCYWLPT